MNKYILLIILLIIVIIVSVLILLYLLYDEKKLKEVSNELLTKLGKKYTKEEFENEMFAVYSNILSGIQNNNYNYFRDMVSDDEYNKILMKAKENTDNNTINHIDNIQKGFSKLISFRVNNEYEVAKLWIQYTDNEYTLGNREVQDEEGNTSVEEVVIKGDKNKEVYHEEIITFVKGRANNEDILCPNCGYHTKILDTSKCVKCDSILAPKKEHWIYLNKVATNISKNKKTL